MSDDRQVPRRRRRPPVAPAPQEPMRIIVGNEEDTPDWMVSDTSGAASRRTGQKKPEPETPERVVHGAQETQTILQMKQPRSGQSEARAERTASGAKRTAAPKAEQKTGASARKAPAPKKKNAHPMSKKAKERRARQIRRTTIGALCAVIAVVLAVIGIRAGSRLVDIKQTLDRGDGTTAVYAIPADTLTGLTAYGNDPRDSLLCIPMYSKNADSAAALIELMLEKLR